jgi:hypothetical protein
MSGDTPEKQADTEQTYIGSADDPFAMPLPDAGGNIPVAPPVSENAELVVDPETGEFYYVEKDTPYKKEPELTDADVLLTMTAEELQALPDKKLVKAIEIAKLLVSGHRDQANAILAQAGGDKTITAYLTHLIRGKIPVTLADYYYATDADLTDKLKVPKFLANVARISRMWIAGEKQKVFDACDDIATIMYVSHMIEDVDVEQGNAFDTMIQSKMSGFVQDPEQLTKLWLLGEKRAVVINCKSNELKQKVAESLEKISPQQALAFKEAVA